MSIYTIALFLHVIGVIGYCLGIGMWLFVLAGLRRAQRVEQVRALIHLNDLSGPFSGISALLLLAAGLYMALTAWSLLTGWILVALISLLLMVPTSAALIVPRRRALVGQMAREAPEGALSEALKQRINDPVILTVVQTVAALLLGLIFLMTTKPDVVGSLIVMAVALLLGLASSVLIFRAARTRMQREFPQVSNEREPVG
jgi:hypothetical protein